MTKTAYTVPEVPESSRLSHRPYTHAVIGRYNTKAARDSAYHDSTIKMYQREWHWHQRVIKLGVGKAWDHFNDGQPLLVDQGMVDRATLALGGTTNVEDFVAHRIAGHIAQINKQHGTGPTGELEVLQWSMSERAATKSVRLWQGRGFVEVRVTTCEAA